MKYFCNPLNVPYHYQFTKHMFDDGIDINREAADPSLILFHGKYYLFASMNLSVWVSENLSEWKSVRLPDDLPLYDYAPDVRVIGEYVYFSASRRDIICDFYRTQDVENGPYERIEGTFDFWDPNIFEDDDGRIYFYWGCSCQTPVWGVELDPKTLQPITERKILISGDPFEKGYERVGENHSRNPLTEEEIDIAYEKFLKETGRKKEEVAPLEEGFIRGGIIGNRPFIEGAWMTKHNGLYYLQYAATGAEYNVYCDGCYVSEYPLGPFRLAKNNPYSYKPGGFLPGAGHGSTLEDLSGNYWHASTMRISINNSMERRVGLWPAGFDAEGNLFCNQNYGDWPMAIPEGEFDPWKEPEWFLLNYRKKMYASSWEEGKEPEKAADENVQTWWRAASNQEGEWLVCDLGEVMDIRAVQINFADDKISMPVPGEFGGVEKQRYIDDSFHATRWLLEGSVDGETYSIIEDKRQADTDLTHDLVVRENGVCYRFIRLTIYETAFHLKPCISGLRIFGRGNGSAPEIPEFSAMRAGNNDMKISLSKTSGAVGWNILWGEEEDKLYHSCLTFEPEKNIGALVRNREYFVRVDAFNENGITHGNTVKLA